MAQIARDRLRKSWNGKWIRFALLIAMVIKRWKVSEDWCSKKAITATLQCFHLRESFRMEINAVKYYFLLPGISRNLCHSENIFFPAPSEFLRLSVAAACCPQFTFSSLRLKASSRAHKRTQERPRGYLGQTITKLETAVINIKPPRLGHTLIFAFIMACSTCARHSCHHPMQESPVFNYL